MSGDQMLQRRDTAANWASTNPILGDGEIGVAQDTFVVKIGDGVHHWNDLTFVIDMLGFVALAGAIMTGRLQLPEIGVTESDTLTIYQEGTSTLGKLAAGNVYDNGARVYSASNPPPGSVPLHPFFVMGG